MTNPADSLPMKTIDVEKSNEIMLLLHEQAIEDGVRELLRYDTDIIVEFLDKASPNIIRKVLKTVDKEKMEQILNATSGQTKQAWQQFLTFKDETVGAYMKQADVIFSPGKSVAETIEIIRKIPREKVFTYGYVVDENKKLVGVIVIRELLLAELDDRLEDIMLKKPFYLTPDLGISEAMKKVAALQIPEYPVCNIQGELVGTVRGQALFEGQVFEISAQAGKMVGVVKEEQTSTPFSKSLKFRHPWLQVNLVTAFAAGAVVSLFQATIDQIVLLAVFLPILAGQAGNTGAQSMVITIRAISLGQLESGKKLALLIKELKLGLVNGAVTGLIAATVMYIMASSQDNPNALLLALIIFVAMLVSCLVSGFSGAALPILLKKLNLDPAASTSIFLTTATDIVSMGLMLGLATWLLL